MKHCAYVQVRGYIRGPRKETSVFDILLRSLDAYLIFLLELDANEALVADYARLRDRLNR